MLSAHTPINAQECRTLTAACMMCVYQKHSLTVCMPIIIRSIELYTLDLNRVLVLFSSELVHNIGVRGRHLLCDI